MRRALAGIAAAALVAGCGSGSEAVGPEPPDQNASGGTLTWALAGTDVSVDPLRATRRAAQTITRQIHEPLIDEVSPPLEGGPSRQGLVVSTASSSDRRVWRLRLRRRVRFQDGQAFNAAAVVANAERWRSRPEGRRLVPGLRAADAPRPDVARLIFEEARPDLRRRLESPQLGIVSPAALGGPGDRLRRSENTGTGAFELRERNRGREVVLARNNDWWGRRLGLGPALELVRFRTVGGSEQALAMLRTGEVQVADGLDAAAVAGLRSDPLVDVSRRGGGALGVERSVRGLGPLSGTPYLSEVWLTSLGRS
ncbi:MAG: ABC transporter substrate-binding protein [Solirubrobacterales bacterium]